MKVRFFTGLVAVLLFGVSCVATGPVGQTEPETKRDAGIVAVPFAELPAIENNVLRVHYTRSDENYENMVLWLWMDAAEPGSTWPNGMEPTGFTQEYGPYYDVLLKPNAQQLGFLAVNKTTGDEGKDGGDKNFSLFSQFNEIWIRQGDDEVYVTGEYQLPVGMVSATIASDSAIEAIFISTEGLSLDDIREMMSVKDSQGVDVPITGLEFKGANVLLAVDVDLEKAPYRVSFGDRTVNASAGWRYIDGAFAYDGWLGPRLNADGTATLKMWSPLVSDVKVVVYHKDSYDTIVQDDIPMVRGSNGVWEVTLNQGNTGLGDLRGYYYNYKVDADGNGNQKLALDPYAPSMAPFSNVRYQIGRSAIVNPSTIGPELDFAEIPNFMNKTDAIIWEVHVRDFTVDPSIEHQLSAPHGTFTAMIDKLDYIQSLGVTHIQLLPIMSYKWGDDYKARDREMEYSASGSNYNWGYDPHSYFSVSGMYSANPLDAELRIQELKTLIDAIHARGMGVILDVVFNHTADLRIFEDLAPGYYHFMDKDGTPRSSFGGGRLGTTHYMARRILVDSLMYWTREFKVDGFRFDMMGDHDAESIQIAYDKVKAVNPNVVMIGEGWRTFVGDEGDRRQAADQDWMAHTDSVAVFSDEFRNELKSGFGSEGQPRFITGGARNINQIFANIKAQPYNFRADQPGDVVPYIAAHDNLTLHDVIAQSIKKDPDVPENHREIHRRIRIGNALVLTSQGVAFIHAGQEYGRTKQWRAPGQPEHKDTFMTDAKGNPFQYPYFVHDSYDSTDVINMFDWTKATNASLHPENVRTRDFTAGLIALRRSTDAFTLGSKNLIEQNVTLIQAPEIQRVDLVMGYRNQAMNGDVYYVFINADNKSRTLTVPFDLTNGQVLVDGQRAGTEPIGNPVGVTISAGSIQLDPLTVVVVKM